MNKQKTGGKKPGDISSFRGVALPPMGMSPFGGESHPPPPPTRRGPSSAWDSWAAGSIYALMPTSLQGSSRKRLGATSLLGSQKQGDPNFHTKHVSGALTPPPHPTKRKDNMVPSCPKDLKNTNLFEPELMDQIRRPKGHLDRCALGK